MSQSCSLLTSARKFLAFLGDKPCTFHPMMRMVLPVTLTWRRQVRCHNDAEFASASHATGLLPSEVSSIPVNGHALASYSQNFEFFGV